MTSKTMLWSIASTVRTATATPVKIGVTSPEKVEILDGVKAGDAIVLTGGYGLGDKVRVEVKGGDAR